MMLPTEVVAQPSAEWFEVKSRLFRFFGTHSGWARWHDASDGSWICGQERDRDGELVRATRVAAVAKDPKLVHSRSMPEHHAVADITAAGWNRLLLGVFTYLGGPARLDDVVTVAGVLLKMPGASSIPTGSAIEPAGAHVRGEEMDAIVEHTLDEAARDRIVAHSHSCSSCAQRLESYQFAVERVSAPIHKPVAL